MEADAVEWIAPLVEEMELMVPKEMKGKGEGVPVVILSSFGMGGPWVRPA